MKQFQLREKKKRVSGMEHVEEQLLDRFDIPKNERLVAVSELDEHPTPDKTVL